MICIPPVVRECYEKASQTEVKRVRHNVLVYIHNMNYDPEKALLACDAIDNLNEGISKLSSVCNTSDIPFHAKH